VKLDPAVWLFLGADALGIEDECLVLKEAVKVVDAADETHKILTTNGHEWTRIRNAKELRTAATGRWIVTDSNSPRQFV
jgi:hypothetical protein